MLEEVCSPIRLRRLESSAGINPNAHRGTLSKRLRASCNPESVGQSRHLRRRCCRCFVVGFHNRNTSLAISEELGFRCLLDQGVHSTPGRSQQGRHRPTPCPWSQSHCGVFTTMALLAQRTVCPSARAKVFTGRRNARAAIVRAHSSEKVGAWRAHLGQRRRSLIAAAATDGEAQENEAPAESDIDQAQDGEMCVWCRV